MAHVAFPGVLPFCIPSITSQDREAMMAFTLEELMHYYWSIKTAYWQSFNASVNTSTGDSYSASGSNLPLISNIRDASTELDLVCNPSAIIPTIETSGWAGDYPPNVSSGFGVNVYNGNDGYYYVNPLFLASASPYNGFGDLYNFFRAGTSDNIIPAFGPFPGDDPLPGFYVQSLGSVGTYTFQPLSGSAKTCPIYGDVRYLILGDTPTMSVNITLIEESDWDYND